MNDVDTKITHITQKNGNVFEDLGFEPQEASKLKIKAQLMCKISEWIKEKDWKPSVAYTRIQLKLIRFP